MNYDYTAVTSGNFNTQVIQEMLVGPASLRWCEMGIGKLLSV